MNNDQLDRLEFAAAIHLTRCQRSSGLRNRDLRHLTDHFGSFQEILHLNEVQLRTLFEEVDCQDSDASPENRAKAMIARAEWIQLLSDHNAFKASMETSYKNEPLQIVPLASGDERFPYRLKNISSCPAILYTRGHALAQALSHPLWVTVIGSRNPTVYGQRVTRSITRDLVARGTVVVSGLARGIDTLAHETTLDQQGLTIAVVGCGLDLVYPPENVSLQQKIADMGVLISEHPPGVPPRKQHFPARNRILSGLSDAVAVMEAAQSSGTLITAGFAGDQGRDVFAVPGSVLDRASSGCHQLIRDGAHLLENSEDIFRVLPQKFIQDLIAQQPDPGKWTRRSGDVRSESSSPSRSPFMQALEQNGAIAKGILNLLRIQSLTLDQLTELSGQMIRDVITAVSFLELGGLIACHRGRYALTASGQSSI